MSTSRRKWKVKMATISKFKVLKETILPAIDTLSRIAVSRSQPIFETILFITDSSKGLLIMMAMNHAQAAVIKIPAKIITDGPIALPARVLKGLVSSMEDGSIEFTTNDKLKTTLKALRSKVNLNGIDPTIMPVMEEVETPDHTIVMDGKDLKELIYAVSFSMATDDLRPAIKNINMVVRNNVMSMYTTNGYRCAKSTASVKSPDLKHVCGGGGMANAMKHMEEGVPVTMMLTDKRTQLEMDNATFSFLNNEGRFPDIEAAIPAFVTTEITVDTDELKSVIEQVMILSRDNNNQVAINITPPTVKGYRGTAVIEGLSKEIGDINVSIDCDVTGDPLRIGVSGKYLLDAIRHIESENISLRFNGDSVPIIAVPEGDDSQLYIIMPMSL